MRAITTAGYRKMIVRTGREGEVSAPGDPPHIRHACGYKLANNGQDTRAVQYYLGPPEHPAHGSIHGVVARALQELLGNAYRYQ